jgi:hypothetical protein
MLSIDPCSDEAKILFQGERTCLGFAHPPTSSRPLSEGYSNSKVVANDCASIKLFETTWVSCLSAALVAKLCPSIAPKENSISNLHPVMLEKVSGSKKLQALGSLHFIHFCKKCAQNVFENPTRLWVGLPNSKAIAGSSSFSTLDPELVADASNAGCLQREEVLSSCPSNCMQASLSSAQDQEVISNSGTVGLENVSNTEILFEAVLRYLDASGLGKEAFPSEGSSLTEFSCNSGTTVLAKVADSSHL